MATKKKARPREVVRVINAAQVTRMMLPDTSEMPIEIREKRDGSFAIFYPEEGWLPCPPRCEARHKHEQVHPYSESFYQPTDLDDALEYAEKLAGVREVKVIERGA